MVMRRIFILLSFILPLTAAADESGKDIRRQLKELSALVQSLHKKVDAQASRLEVLERENALLKQPSAAAPNSVEPASRLSQSSASIATPGAASSGQYLPDIGLVADMVATSSLSDEDAEGNDRLSVREVELVFGHDVDPYSRLDVTASFSDFESPELEEAYLTHFGLPAGFKTKVGKFKPAIGKAIPRHLDSLETVDEPLMIEEYFGHHGLSKSGLELSNYLPLPWEEVTHELSVAIFEGGVGEGATLFSENRRAPHFNTRLKNFWQIDDLNDIELGGTFLLGSADDDTAAEVKAFGADLTYQHYFSSLQKLKLQAEALFQDRSLGFEESEVERGGDLQSFRRHPWGMYTLADLRLASRWSLGSRWDYVQAVNDANSVEAATQALSGYVTFHQSEFARFRLQYQHLELEDGGNDQRFWLQGTFAIGTHKHQLN